MEIPLKKAILMILASTFLVSGSSAICLLAYKYIQWNKVNDSKYDILAIVQATNVKEPLNTSYLAELLNLSKDQPTNIYRFNKDIGTKMLLKSPLIKKAEVKKIYPGTLYVHYIPREPIAFLVDYPNVAIDHESFIFPFKPFFTPKILPEIYLGLEYESHTNLLGTKIKSERIKLALSILNFLKQKVLSDDLVLKRIDVKDAFASSFGQKQIVLVLEDRIEKTKNGKSHFYRPIRVLRLSTHRYLEELNDYLSLRKYIIQKESKEYLSSNKYKIIDLRIPQLAFIKEGKIE